MIHEWIRCNDCGKCFPMVGPKCLATLPSQITKQFRFVLPKLCGPGLYSLIVTLISLLIRHSILFGTLFWAFNTLKCIKFSQSHVSYLDTINNWPKNPPSIGNSKISTPFSQRTDQMRYCDQHPVLLFPPKSNPGRVFLLALIRVYPGHVICVD